VKIELQPKQLAFFKSKAREALFGGAAGGGKSEALLAFSIARRVKYPGTTGLILRSTLPELEGGHGLIARSKDYLHGIAEWREKKKRWEFPNGSVIEFGYCDRDDDVRRYDGSEYADICFDELQQFTEWMYTYIRSRCRVSTNVSSCIPLIRASGMPRGIGVGWVKRVFIAPAPQGGEWPVDLGDAGCITRAFFPSRLEDNQYLNSTPEYRQNLMLLPDHLRKALLEGSWDVFEGCYFSMFDPKRHVLEREVGENWPRMIAIDYGYAAPFCALWGAIDPQGRVHVYRELYRAGLRDEEQARLVKHLSEKENVTICKADPSCWNRRGDSGLSVADVWAQHGLYALKASNERVPGWSRLRSMLEMDIDGVPLLTVSPKCANLIRTLPEMATAANNPEDIDTRQEDHACLTFETPVKVPEGHKPLGLLRPGDLVWTRMGYRTVGAAGQTNEAAEVRRYVLADGRSLECTADHPIYLADGQCRAAGDVRVGDHLLDFRSSLLIRWDTWKLKWFHRRSRFSGASGTTSADRIFSDGGGVCIASFTRPWWAAFSPATMSIIGTATEPTICPTTWSYSLRVSTSPSETGRPLDALPLGAASSRMPFPPPPAGTARRPVVDGMRRMASRLGQLAERRSHPSSIASFVAASLRRMFLRGRSIVTSTARWLISGGAEVVRVEPLGTRSVWNITVQGDHEFLANGILVHNCDSARYLVADYRPPFVPQRKKMIDALSMSALLCKSNRPTVMDMVRSRSVERG